jgi:aminoglycoside phosphotransferase (APT) family kinase protein
MTRRSSRKLKNNAPIAAHTDVPTPTIHQMDVSHELVATGYIVMDYMIGGDRRYLTHPHYRGTTPIEKEQITYRVGMATAKIHTITQATTRAAGTGICHGLDALERGVARDAYKADDGPGIEDREPPIYSKLLAAIEQRRRC